MEVQLYSHCSWWFQAFRFSFLESSSDALDDRAIVPGEFHVLDSLASTAPEHLGPRQCKAKGKPTRRLIGKQTFLPVTAAKFDPKKPASWTCPVCQFTTAGNYGGVICSKIYHMKTRHPEVPAAVYTPLRNLGLWSLLPIYLPRKRIGPVLCALLPFPNLLLRKDSGPFGQTFPNTILVKPCRQFTITPVVDVVALFRPDPTNRAQDFCKDCYGQFTGKSCTKPDVTCADRQQELVNNGFALSRKSSWWNNLKVSDPDQVQAQSLPTITEAEVDDRLKVGVETGSARRWKLGKASRQQAKDPTVSRPKQGACHLTLRVVLVFGDVLIRFLPQTKACAFGQCAARKRFNFYFEPAKGCHI